MLLPIAEVTPFAGTKQYRTLFQIVSPASPSNFAMSADTWIEPGLLAFPTSYITSLTELSRINFCHE